MQPPGTQNTHIGRFAPSPTGDLHFGSLISALASFLQAKHNGGHWLLRIEDIDPPREVPGSAAAIIAELEKLGLKSDGPALYQSNRTDAYRTAVDKLLQEGLAYWCGCSRRDLPSSGVYPGTCRGGLAAGKKARCVRLKVNESIISFTDLVQGHIEEVLAVKVGDFVILRADGLPAYQLAVVLDDAFQEISEVVRGADLLSSTSRQIYLQQCLGLPTPVYAHHPLVVDSAGRKLGKRFGSDPIARLAGVDIVEQALIFLEQSPPSGISLEATLAWAIDHWKLSSIPAVNGLPVSKTEIRDKSFR